MFVLIAAVSARALAVNARRAGYQPLVADLFCDLDTRESSAAFERVPGSLKRGLVGEVLLPALDRLAADRAPIGVVVGPGFEDRPNLLRVIGERYGLLGNSADTVAAVKDPFQFAQMCRAHGISHPDIQREQPIERGWLCKRDGGSGGVHIVAARHASPRPGRYYQRLTAGASVSMAFLADGQSIRNLGFSRQWAAPVLRRRFRYGGACRPARLSETCAQAMTDAVARLVPLVQLRGLNSADFLVSDEAVTLLEINPRPGATLDIFDDGFGTIFKMHVEASAGTLSRTPLVLPKASASAFVYASSNLVIPADFRWPEWAVDRTPGGERIAQSDPFCTVVAVADDVASAEKLLNERAARLWQAISECKIP